MTITPTAQSSLLAGFVLWLVGWATFFHLNEVPYIGKLIDQEKVLNWVNRDFKTKSCALLITEVVNFGVHGISNPAVVLFAIGGTIFNTGFIFGFIPLRQWLKKRQSRRTILRDGFSAAA